MSGLFSSPQPAPIVQQAAPGGITPTAPPLPANTAAATAGQQAAAALGAGIGQQSTILTSGLGAPGMPNVRQKVLLGQ